MIFPYRTDAPVYHWPLATAGLIVVNVLVFVAMESGALDGDAVAELSLQFGDGLHPLQWVTWCFIHGGVLHLLGNMAFLWVFGLVIEGKVGWYWFLLIYLGMGAVQGAVEQICFLGLPGHSAYGASGVLFGLLAMAMVWAPENEAQIFYWILVRPGTASIRISMLCLLYLVIELALALMDSALGSPVGSSLLHLVGAVIGFPVAVGLLKAGLVDCEGWDIFSLRKKKALRGAKKGAGSPGRPGEDAGALPGAPARAQHGSDAPGVKALTPLEQRVDALVLLRDHLKSGDAVAAKVVYAETVKETGPWPLPAPDLLAMIKALQKSRLWLDSLPFLEDHLQRFSGRSAAMRLLLGKVLIEDASRPASGLEVLEAIPAGELTEAQAATRQKLIRKAQQLRDQGVLELDVE